MVCAGGEERGGEGSGKDVEGRLGHITYQAYAMMNLIIQYKQRGLVLGFVFMLGLILYC